MHKGDYGDGILLTNSGQLKLANVWNKFLLDNLHNNMNLNDVRLGTFDGSDFDKGAGFLKATLWYFVNALIVRASWNPFMGIKVALLRTFGAKIGKG